MRYRITIVFWIIFLIICSIYQNQANLNNEILSGSEVIYGYNNDINELYMYDNVEYFSMFPLPTGETIVLGNTKYYEALGLVAPGENEYYGKGKIEGYKNIGSAPYLDIMNNTYYLNLDLYKDSIPKAITWYYRLEDRSKMYEIQKNLEANDMTIGIVQLNYIHTSFYLLYYLTTILLLLLLFLFLFVDISLYLKEIIINKILGYNMVEILTPVIKKHIVYSLIYFLPLIIPLFIYVNNMNALTFGYLICVFLSIIKIYIISVIVYLLAFIYVSKRSNIILILKNQKNSSLINNISLATNIISKVIIVLILMILMVPSYQLVRTGGQYFNYIKGSEDYIRYNIDSNIDEEQAKLIYNEKNAKGAIVNARTGDYKDIPYYENDSQIIMTNYNYMENVHLEEGLARGQNYLLIPKEMEESTSEIKDDVTRYLEGDYETFYYTNKEMYTYSYDFPTYYMTGGYIYYPVILVVDDWTNSLQNSYMLGGMYYENKKPPEYSLFLTASYPEYFQVQLEFFLTFLLLFILFAGLVLVSTNYMIKSYIDMNGKEIVVKKILGYSNFKIYNEFYISDIIFYVGGNILLILISRLFIIPLWFNIIFIFIMIILNEYGRGLLIKKIEQKNIINIIKGEI